MESTNTGYLEERKRREKRQVKEENTSHKEQFKNKRERRQVK